MTDNGDELHYVCRFNVCKSAACRVGCGIVRGPPTYIALWDHHPIGTGGA